MLLLAFLMALPGCSASRPDSPAERSHALAGQQAAGSEVAAPAPERMETMPALMEEINRKHEAVVKPEIKFADYIHGSPDKAFDLTAYGQGKRYDEAALLSAKQVMRDVDVLFKALQSAYGPYHYFGGDDVFLEAEGSVLERCKAQKSLTAGELSALLVEQLRFIRDAHFTINGVRFFEPVKAHVYNLGSAYLRAGEAYVTADGGRVVASIAEKPPEELLRLSISPEGEVVYYPVVLLENGLVPESLCVRYADGGSETLLPPEWKSGYEQSGVQVELRDRQGIPVLFARSMDFDQAPGGENGKVFLRYAERLRESPVSMVDLRSNGGGNGILPLKWLSAFTGTQVTTNHLTFQRWNEEEMRAYGQDPKNPYYVPIEEMQTYDGSAPFNAEYRINGDLPDNFVPSEPLLLILTGKNTASAAEIFVDAAMNVENTLIIGQNTYGMLLSNAYTALVLPESGIVVQLGSDLRVFAEGSFEEYVGYSPDLWVSEAEAEELAVKLVQNLMR